MLINVPRKYSVDLTNYHVFTETIATNSDLIFGGFRSTIPSQDFSPIRLFCNRTIGLISFTPIWIQFPWKMDSTRREFEQVSVFDWEQDS